ncbi:phage major capsid protein [Phytomonospora endophytica]|uniref:HK97 family phage major capsid protein n=1 Tax=Phytomonospora endophytica TaxID=714109 RepID=A0A841G5E7_9ACTN|nr:phage major capsid protein [Phytomonospora endophytica]MBB6039320.1 HK97 family phage major capsid protein [Phytomonospora endophytica]GIG69738.1 hypothetical protein Pen01_60330 [Phytomonospora endophytica]
MVTNCTPNPVISRLEEQREAQVEFVDNLLSHVEDDGGRDLVDAEQGNLVAARERIAAIDAQLKPLREFETLRASADTATTRAVGGGARVTERAAPSAEDGPVYDSPGALLLDRVRSFGAPKIGIARDPAAAERLTRAVAKMTTAETPGILPTPIVGPVINIIDARRPLITSLGVRPLGNIPGKTFSRPIVTQHTKVGVQTAEKTELASQALKVESLEFPKATYGGVVNVSRQDIDWTDPGAWNILTTDLADQYGLATEAATATAFATGITQSVTVATNDLAGWATALYSAAAKAYAGGQRMPDTIWCSVDMWAIMGAVCDTARLMLPPRADGNGGTQDITSFSGDVFNAPRIVAPLLPEKTVIVGSKSLYEYYEVQLGLIQAIEPSILGVEVAYGGYAASGFLEPKGFCKIAPAVVPPVETQKAGK